MMFIFKLLWNINWTLLTIKPLFGLVFPFLPTLHMGHNSFFFWARCICCTHILHLLCLFTISLKLNKQFIWLQNNVLFNILRVEIFGRGQHDLQNVRYALSNLSNHTEHCLSQKPKYLFLFFSTVYTERNCPFGGGWSLVQNIYLCFDTWKLIHKNCSLQSTKKKSIDISNIS